MNRTSRADFVTHVYQKAAVRGALECRGPIEGSTKQCLFEWEPGQQLRTIVGNQELIFELHPLTPADGADKLSSENTIPGSIF